MKVVTDEDGHGERPAHAQAPRDFGNGEQFRRRPTIYCGERFLHRTTKVYLIYS